MSQPTNKAVSPSARQKHDQVFMGVVMGVQQEVQASRPAQAGALAAMFHKEQLSEALQGCAMLIAGWNAGVIDAAGVARAARALRGLDRPDLAVRVEGLVKIEEDGGAE
ncbi:hypothetical protein [Deinococcus sp.]|uniref:hypothetical protein n=1 Tax=Deinococcus sp. TaxID=47478 RepID=UPI003CC57F00